MHVQATKFFVLRRERPGRSTTPLLKKSERGVRGWLKIFCRGSVAMPKMVKLITPGCWQVMHTARICGGIIGEVLNPEKRGNSPGTTRGFPAGIREVIGSNVTAASARINLASAKPCGPGGGVRAGVLLPQPTGMEPVCRSLELLARRPVTTPLILKEELPVRHDDYHRNDEQQHRDDTLGELFRHNKTHGDVC